MIRLKKKLVLAAIAMLTACGLVGYVLIGNGIDADTTSQVATAAQEFANPEQGSPEQASFARIHAESATPEHSQSSDMSLLAANNSNDTTARLYDEIQAVDPPLEPGVEWSFSLSPSVEANHPRSKSVKDDKFDMYALLDEMAEERRNDGHAIGLENALRRLILSVHPDKDPIRNIECGVSICVVEVATPISERLFLQLHDIPPAGDPLHRILSSWWTNHGYEQVTGFEATRVTLAIYLRCDHRYNRCGKSLH
jgi:hypothetical protein